MPTHADHNEPTKPTQNIAEILNDPARLTMSVSQAAKALGISKSTASNAHRKTGFLTEGVRVLRIGKRCVVSCAELRRALGMTEPTAN
jgi:hypothetical protein